MYRLTLTSLTDLEHATWSAPEDKVNTCQNKGQSVEDCRNYVKVLLSNGKSLFTCGTYAFSPWCAWREVFRKNFVQTPRNLVHNNKFYVLCYLSLIFFVKILVNHPSIRISREIIIISRIKLDLSSDETASFIGERGSIQ